MNVVINRSRFEEETLAAYLITSLVIVRKLLKISLLGLQHPAAPSTQHHPLHGLMEPLTERRAITCSICMMVTITNKSSAPPLRGAAGLVCIGSSPSSRRHHLSHVVKKKLKWDLWCLVFIKSLFRTICSGLLKPLQLRQRLLAEEDEDSDTYFIPNEELQRRK